jgi:hypothetical protein
MRPVLRPLVAAAVCAIAILAGCATDDPLAPLDPGPGPPPPNFDLPESTLATLERAVENRLVSDYALCFTDSAGRGEPGFYASFDPADLIEWLQVNPPPGTWTLLREITFFPRFLAYAPGAFYAMTLVPTRADEIPDTETRILHRSYRVFAGPTPVAAGEAVLTFRRVSLAGEWKISFWEDRRDTTGVRTWGTARLEGR